VYDEEAIYAAVSPDEFERARYIAARLLGITPEEAVSTGHSIEVAKVLTAMARSGRLQRIYVQNGVCSYKRADQGAAVS
jgi:hypothetical protein